MTRSLYYIAAIGSLVLIAAVAFSPDRIARAEIIQPWCLGGGGGLTDHCDFATYAQCKATSAGFGICSRNPALGASRHRAPMLR